MRRRGGVVTAIATKPPTKKQVAARREWFRGLSARQRYLLLSQWPDALEREETLASETWIDLETHLGPRVWPASLANQAEPLDEEPPEHDDLRSDGMTLAEIGAELRLSSVRVQQIEQKALRKFRAAWLEVAKEDERATKEKARRAEKAVARAIDTAKRAKG